ncbi:LysR family transcriptional regulator [Streptomyces sp. NBC_00237]|uniref:LysR family transcriptional regulator n=1 Tax=Streptomyces sp. NBC_00237 TaxID=2975687 RepID=UPI00224DC6B3|nr:LysR family transcriptional regulator [Streptomyces sp. NBC_00237]MCX5205993.1 LysR family transcriptional regulator [Streptomyces sp. NBC_00237]
MFTWERLRVFAAVGQHGSVGAAAAALHITGPAVSQHIRKLEKETQVQLVEPDGRGIRLTAAGRVLAASAREMAITAEDAERDLANIHGVVAGPLRIGSVSSALRDLVPRSLRHLIERHPRLEPELSDGEPTAMLPLLRTRQLDAVITESWVHRPAHLPPGVHTTTLVKEDVALAVHENHRLADRESVALGELHGEVWASCPEGSDAQESLLQLLRAHGVEAEVRHCLGDYATQMHLVAAGLTVAMAPEMVRRSGPPGVRYLPCRPSLTRTISVATAAGAQTPTVRAFIEETLRLVGATVAAEETGQEAPADA